MYLKFSRNFLSLKSVIRFSKQYKSYKFIPSKPTWTPKFYPDNITNTSIDYEMVYLLERLSLTDFGTAKSVQVLVDAINFVSDIKSVDTTNVELKTRIWDDSELWIRNENDKKTHTELSDTMGSLKDVMKNSEFTFEDYFTAPIGNRPIEKDFAKSEMYNVINKAKD